jgi:hypothetical protein
MNLLVALALLASQNDKAQANAYDDAWESAWVTHCRQVYNAGTGKADGMVIHIGDSITHANPYGQWPRQGAGKTTEDIAVLTWCGATSGGSDATSTNGFFLCAVDVANRSMTASSSITTAMYLSGIGNGGDAASSPPMPATTDQAVARTHVSDPNIPRNLHATTVAAAFSNARFAVVMLGTNDAGANRSAGDVANDLGTLVDILEGRKIVPILSTIPPRSDRDVTAINAAIRSLAQTRQLPLIDYYAEILARRPGTTWQGTLISSDGVHPTNANTTADPYAGGDPAAHRTGANATTDGYMLRGWLSVQKLKEVKSYVVDGVNPPSTPPPSTPPPSTPPPAVVSSGRDNDNGEGCSLGTIGARLPWALGLLALLLVGRRR